MITYFKEECNSNFNDITYNNDICSIDFLLIPCPKCHHCGCLVHHAYYSRTIKLADRTVKIRVLRVICNECGSTHAVLPSFTVPYSQLSVDIQAEVCSKVSSETIHDIINNNPDIEEADLRYVIRKYSGYWKQRIISYSISFDKHLTEMCFKWFSRQFMQLRRLFNILFHIPT